MALVLAWQLGGEVLVGRADADSHGGGHQYLVLGKGGPGLGTPEEWVTQSCAWVCPQLGQIWASCVVFQSSPYRKVASELEIFEAVRAHAPVASGKPSS